MSSLEETPSECNDFKQPLLSQGLFEKGQREGAWMQFYASGALYARLFYRQGKKEGKQEYFYEEGTLKTVEFYEEGRLHKEALLYWPNGALKRKCSFVFGIREGLDQMFSDQGQVLDAGSYQKGKPVGIHQRFDAKGNRIEQIQYLESPRFNIWQWDATGQLRTQAEWIDETNYQEIIWDRFEKKWIEKKGIWNGKKLVYL